MAGVAQLVRASGCGPEGRGFETHHSPHNKKLPYNFGGFLLCHLVCRAFPNAINEPGCARVVKN